MTEPAITEEELIEGYGGRNGTQFPLNSFREAAVQLRRPFTPQAVKFKVQATWPKKEPTGGLIVSYIDARLVAERLNLVVPHLWFDSYESVDKPNFLRCALTIDGITRTDVGQGDGKGLYSDALKRAAVKFGVGVSLYAVPKMILNVKDGHLAVKGTGERTSVVLTPSGEARVRELYTSWLSTSGIQAFGQPLDHGDAADAVGDVEAEAPPLESEPEQEHIPEDRAAQLEDMLHETGWSVAKVKMQLGAAGAQDTSDVKAALRSLTAAQEEALRPAINAAIDARSEND